MKTEVIKFYSQDITFITENTLPQVCIKHLCEGIGLNETSALRELKKTMICLLSSVLNNMLLAQMVSNI